MPRSAKTIALTVLGQLRTARLVLRDPKLKLAAALTDILPPHHFDKSTHRFQASFAIEALRTAVNNFEKALSLKSRHAHAIRLTEAWLETLN